MVQGQPLILHAANSVARFAMRCTAVAAIPDQYADLGLRTIADSTANQGPLGGLVRALRDLADEDRLLLVSCDLVLLDVAAVERLLLRSDGHAAVAFHTDCWQPIPGVYSRQLIPQAEALLQRGDGLVRLLDLHGVAIPIDNWGEIALDVNTREAWLRANTLVKEGFKTG